MNALAPEYTPSTHAARATANLGGLRVDVEVGRARAYPGLPSEAPDTRAYYALATEKLAGAERVLDVGAGAGRGARILAEAFDAVVAIDAAAEATEFFASYASGIDIVRADGVPAHVRGDAAVLVDVLGHVKSPRALFRSVHAALPAGAKILVAEARAYPSQSLRAPSRRAFSPRALAAMLGAAGFDVVEVASGNGPFVAMVATTAADDSPHLLTAAEDAFARGDLELAARLLEEAEESSRAAVRLEARVTLGDLRLACGDGDGAARAYFAARRANEDDPRPAAGLARLTLALGDSEGALALARTAHSLDPACSVASCALAMALSRRLPGAEVSALRAAAALAPDDEAIAMACAEAAARCGATKAALFALERTLRYGDALPAAFHVLMGELLVSSDRREDAKLSLRLAEAIAPESSDVARLRASIRADAKR